MGVSTLIIKQGALGDVIIATALVDAIMKARPAGSVTLLTTPPFAGLFTDWADLRVVAWQRRGWRAMTATLGFIRSQGFSEVFDLQGNDRSRLLCTLSGIPRRIGSHLHYPYNVHPAAPWDEQSHVFTRLNAVLEAAGLPAAAPRPVLPCAGSALAEVRAFIKEAGLQAGQFVVMHAGASASRQDKCWPGFGELALALAAQGLTTVWLGGSDDVARNRQLAARTGIDSTGRFRIAQLAALAAQARFAVTNDSGPMHACAAAGVPVFALFGPSDWARNHALGQADNVLAGVRLLPDLAGQRTADCLARISPAMVLAKLAGAGLIASQATG